jgi:hypothetical protein
MEGLDCAGWHVPTDIIIVYISSIQGGISRINILGKVTVRVIRVGLCSSALLDCIGIRISAKIVAARGCVGKLDATLFLKLLEICQILCILCILCDLICLEWIVFPATAEEPSVLARLIGLMKIAIFTPSMAVE